METRKNNTRKITFFPDNKTIEVPQDVSVLKAANMLDIHINASCGGKATCGKCVVSIKEGEFETEQSSHLSREETGRGHVLSCQTHALTDLVVDIPLESRMQKGHKIATGASSYNLQEKFREICGEIVPRTKKFCITLPPPNLTDNISDLERLKRELARAGYGTEHFHCNHALLRKMGRVLRDSNWKVNVTLYETGTALELLELQPCVTGQKRYGVAVDVGTTTVVVYLVDMKDGHIIDRGSTYNAQVRCGDDVITRIVYATEMGGLQELQRLVIENVNTLISDMARKHGVAIDLIDNIVIAGNTTMTHLFYGIDPAHIREEPYIPTATVFPLVRARSLGLKLNEQTLLYSAPCVASYVGGDISAGVLAAQLHKREDVCIFIDVGTNGEIVLGNHDWMMTAACSAGPCFEGSGIKHGMRAMEGAIEAVTVDPRTLEPAFEVIGGVKPIGICGSGMIDALAEMYLSGVIDQQGKIREDLKHPRIRLGDHGLEYVLAWRVETGINKEIVLTEVDLDNLIRAKGAIYAGFTTLLAEMGMTFDDITKLYIAGGFGNYINVERAITIGMLPDMPMDKFEFLGNTSATGAYFTLLNDDLRKELEEIASKMTYMEFSVARSFMDEYMSALFLPHTDIGAFPSVKALMEERARMKG